MWLRWGFVLLVARTELCFWLQLDYVLLTDCEQKCVSGCGEVMHSWRIVKWTVCVVAVRLCIADRLWTVLRVCLQWGYLLMADCEFNCVWLCIAGRYWTEQFFWLRWVYVFLADCKLNSMCGCGEVMYCWRFVNLIVCVVAVRLCIGSGLWTELCVWLRWGYVQLADSELNTALTQLI